MAVNSIPTDDSGSDPSRTDTPTTDEVGDLAPTRVSAAVTTLAVGITVCMTAAFTGAIVAVGLVTLAGAGFAVSVRGIQSSHPGVKFSANFGVPVTGIALILGVVLGASAASALLPFATILGYLGLGAAVFGATTTWWAGIGDREIYRVLWTILFIFIPPFLLLVGISWRTLDAQTKTTVTETIGSVHAVLDVFTITSGPAAGMIASLFAASTLALYTVGCVVRRLPVLELRQRDARDSFQAQLDRLQTYRKYALRASALLLVVFGGAAVITPTAVSTIVPAPLLALLTGIASITALRILFLGIAGTAIGSLGCIWVLRRLMRLSIQTLVARGIPLFIGTVFTLVVVGVAAEPIYTTVHSRMPTSLARQFATLAADLGTEVLVLLGVIVVLFVFLLTAFVPVALAGFGFLPKRTAAPALAGAGVYVVGVAHAMAGGDALSVFVFVALGMVAWDTGEYALTLGETVGRSAGTTHSELVHAGAATLIGAVGVIVAWVTLSVIPTLSVTLPAPVVLAAGLLGFLLLAAILRG